MSEEKSEYGSYKKRKTTCPLQVEGILRQLIKSTREEVGQEFMDRCDRIALQVQKRRFK